MFCPRCASPASRLQQYAGGCAYFVKGGPTDLPKVIPVTRRFLEEDRAASRVTTLVGDMIADGPAGTYDVAVRRNLFQVLSLADAQAVVRHVGQSLAQMEPFSSSVG